MYRVTLTSEQMAELNRRCHDAKTKPRTRERLEMLRLADGGWSIPKLARPFNEVVPFVKTVPGRLLSSFCSGFRVSAVDLGGRLIAQRLVRSPHVIERQVT